MSEIPVSQISLNNSTVKKKPGRPRIKAANAPIEICGIVSQTSDPEFCVELVYGNPVMFKKIIHLLKAFQVGDVDIEFTHDYMRLLSLDHLKRSTIIATVWGKSMNMYCCKAPVRVCVQQSEIEKILGVLAKNHYKITIIVKQSTPSLMHILVKDIDLDIDECYDIAVVQRADTAQYQFPDESKYQLKFTLPRTHFKNRINNVKKLGPTVVFRKCGTGALQILSDKVHGVCGTGFYNDPRKIFLESTVGPDDIVNVSLSIDYIHPFSNSSVGDTVTITIDKREKIVFTTNLDRREDDYAAEIRICTEIRDYRRDETFETA